MANSDEKYVLTNFASKRACYKQFGAEKNTWGRFPIDGVPEMLEQLRDAGTQRFLRVLITASCRHQADG